MNKILSMLLCAGLAMTAVSCVNEEDDIFDSSAAHRAHQAAIESAQALYDSPNGWVMEYYPTNYYNGFKAKGYLILANFHSNYSVEMAMKNAFSSDAFLSDESVWDVVTDNGPVLTFNTFNECIHRFADPGDLNSDISPDDDQGVGAEGDYEFVVIDAQKGAGQIMLKGKKRGTYVRLSRIDEGVEYKDYLDMIEKFYARYFSTSAPNMPRITIADSVMIMRDGSTAMPNIYGCNSDYILDENICPFLVIVRGGKYYLRFRQPLEAGNGEEQEFVFDEEADKFVGVANSANVIQPEKASNFFMAAFADGLWQFGRNNDKSDALQQKYEDVVNEFKSKKYTLNNMQFINSPEGYMLRVAYRYQYKQYEEFYLFDVAATEKGVSLSYTGPQKESGSNLLGNVPSLGDFFTALTADYSVKPVGTGFNMSTLNLTAADDKWLNVSFIK